MHYSNIKPLSQRDLRQVSGGKYKVSTPSLPYDKPFLPFNGPLVTTDPITPDMIPPMTN